jgi:hypothetical protein
LNYVYLRKLHYAETYIGGVFAITYCIALFCRRLINQWNCFPEFRLFLYSNRCLFDSRLSDQWYFYRYASQCNMFCNTGLPCTVCCLVDVDVSCWTVYVTTVQIYYRENSKCFVICLYVGLFVSLFLLVCLFWYWFCFCLFGVCLFIFFLYILFQVHCLTLHISQLIR